MPALKSKLMDGSEMISTFSLFSLMLTQIVNTPSIYWP
jgi:hypothetical protein